MINMGKKILESLEVKFMNLPPYVFGVDNVAKIRSGLSITVLEKKTPLNHRSKSDRNCVNVKFKTFNLVKT